MQAGRINVRKITCPAEMHKGMMLNCTARKQRGVVLLIALIILVAMTLAGIGMMRSIDTGNMIAGNLAFRDSTTSVSDAGTTVAFNAIAQVTSTALSADNKAAMSFDGNNTQPCNPQGITIGVNPPLPGVLDCSGGKIKFPLTPSSYGGYYSAPYNKDVVEPCQVTTGCDSEWWQNAANWNSTAHPPAVITVPDPNIPNSAARCPTGSAAGTYGCLTLQYLIHRMCTVPNAAPPVAPATWYFVTGAGQTQYCQLYTSPSQGSQRSGVALPPPTSIIFYRVTVRAVGPHNSVSVTQLDVEQTQ